jgi:H+/Cl- antiporter ClcA
MSEPRPSVDLRVVRLAALSAVLAAVAALAAQVLVALINLITNLAFYSRFSAEPVSPANHALGPWSVIVPIAGALIVGLMARFGSPAIRGHGIPEAMEQVLFNESRIPARIVFLKPVSAAISIGTGGPFGAEGPIIATGGALGSLLGQVLHVSADERKTLLAAGAAAGMTATFGSPVSAVLLAIELLLFEYRPRSLVPVSLAAATAAAIRIAINGTAPMFQIPELHQPSGVALSAYVALGALIGLASVGVTRAVYAVEDSFERLPIHWMWWPALGGVAVGLVGLVAPRTMGVGYDNLEDMLSGKIGGTALAVLCIFKLISWSLSLGSGTSGGTLAPLFTIGGGLGAVIATIAAAAVPSLGLDVRIAALVGMAAMFAGASRALLASVVFAFEITRQPIGLLPLLGGCTAAYLISLLLMRNSIMTEKIVRRGVRVPTEYAADFLDRVLVEDLLERQVVTLDAASTLASVRGWLAAGGPGRGHHGFPVLEGGRLVGVLTRRDLLEHADHAGAPLEGPIRALISRPLVAITGERSLRDAADRMAHEGVGRLPVVDRDEPERLVGIVTRSDLLAAHGRRLAEAKPSPPEIALFSRRRSSS